MTKTLKTTPWEAGNRTKLVPWEEEIILTAEETRILLELQEFAKSKLNDGSRFEFVVVPATIFDKLVRVYGYVKASD